MEKELQSICGLSKILCCGKAEAKIEAEAEAHTKAADGYGDGGPEAEDGYEDGGPEPSAANIKNVCFAFRKTHPKSHICNGLLGRVLGCVTAAASARVQFFCKNVIVVPLHPRPSGATIKNVRFAFRKTHPKSHICKGLLGRARLRYGCSQRACAFFAKTGVAVQLHPQVQTTKNVAFANKNAY